MESWRLGLLLQWLSLSLRKAGALQLASMMTGAVVSALSEQWPGRGSGSSLRPPSSPHVGTRPAALHSRRLCAYMLHAFWVGVPSAPCVRGALPQRLPGSAGRTLSTQLNWGGDHSRCTKLYQDKSAKVQK